MKIAMAWPREGRHTKAQSWPTFRLRMTAAALSIVRSLQRGMSLLIFVSLAWAGWWWQDSHEREAMALRYETAAARTEALNRGFDAQLTKEGLNFSGQEIARIQGKIVFANQLSQKRAFSWTRLLRDLEETVPAQVSIASVKLDFQQSHVVLDGVAQSLQDVNAFVQALQRHAAFQAAVLAKHEVQKKHGAAATTASSDSTASQQSPIEFTLMVGYEAAMSRGDSLQ